MTDRREGDVVHWGLLILSIVLGVALLVGVSGLWGSEGSVMWVTRVLFFGFLFATLWSILTRRRDMTTPDGR
jgi:hypothetical protein